MVRFSNLIACSLTAAIALTAPAATFAQSADEMTAEQIAEAFKKQKTRGLVIVPSGQQAETSEATSVAPATPPPIQRSTARTRSMCRFPLALTAPRWPMTRKPS